MSKNEEAKIDVIGKLQENATTISKQIRNVQELISKNKKQYNNNICTINNKFDELTKLVNEQRLSLLNDAKIRFENNNETLVEQESRFKTLYSSSLNVSNQFKQLCETRQEMSTHELSNKERSMNKLINTNENIIKNTMLSFDKLCTKLDIIINTKNHNQIKNFISNVVRIDTMLANMILVYM